jgi:hypothetical protein
MSGIVVRSESALASTTNPAYPKGGGWWTFPRVIWELGTVVGALLSVPPEKHINKAVSATVLPAKTFLRDSTEDGSVTN